MAIDIRKYCEYVKTKVAHINGSLYKHHWINGSRFKTYLDREKECINQFTEALCEDYKVIILDKPNLTHAEYYWYERAARENQFEVQVVECQFESAEEAIEQVRLSNDPDFQTDQEIREAYESFKASCDQEDKSVIRYQEGGAGGQFYFYLACRRFDYNGEWIDDSKLWAARSSD